MHSVLKCQCCPAGPTGNSSKHPSFRCHLRLNCENLLGLTPAWGQLSCRQSELSKTINRIVAWIELCLAKVFHGKWRLGEQVQRSGGSELNKCICFKTLKNQRGWIMRKRTNTSLLILRNSWKYKKYDLKNPHTSSLVVTGRDAATVNYQEGYALCWQLTSTGTFYI